MTIKTSDDHDKAASQSRFFYTFIGNKGETLEYQADNQDDRQRGQEDTWTFTDNENIGEFRCIVIRMRGGNSWIFGKVNIRITRYGVNDYFLP